MKEFIVVEATDAKDMTDEAIERAEDQRTAAETAERIVERRFRDRVSLLWAFSRYHWRSFIWAPLALLAKVC